MSDRPGAGALAGRAAVGAGAARRRPQGMLLAVALALAACQANASPTPTGGPTPSPTPARTATPAATATVAPTATATPEPPLSLAVPEQRDPRSVRVAVSPDVPTDGDGRIVVTVTNLSNERVTELVLRWPTALRDALFLAPFEPSVQRIAQGGPPLYQDWTKWVDGPGESGEPAGTTSLGWGPLDPGATLTIPVLVTRRASGPVAFDLQILAGEAILTDETGAPAELRVEVD